VSDVALVCGGGGALGSALVDVLLERGDTVVAVDRSGDGEARERLRREVADLTSASEVDALWERLAAADVRPRWVVNAAGGFRAGTVADTGPELLRFVSELNVGTAWWSCRAAAKGLPEGGAIVNVGARAALSGGAGTAAYAVAKAAAVRLTEVLAAELRDRKVRVNAILPALIDTPANRATMSPDQLRNAVAPAELASVVSFLLSDAASAVTGAIVPVYGWA